MIPVNCKSDPTDPSYYDPTNPESPYYNPALAVTQATQQATQEIAETSNDVKHSKSRRRQLRANEGLQQAIQNSQPGNVAPDPSVGKTGK